MKKAFFIFLLLLFCVQSLYSGDRLAYICEEENGCEWYIDSDTLSYNRTSGVLNYWAVILVSPVYREQLLDVHSKEHHSLRAVASKLSQIHIHQNIDTKNRCFSNIEMLLYDASFKRLDKVHLNSNRWSPIGYETPVSRILYWVDIDTLIEREDAKRYEILLAQQNNQKDNKVSPEDKYVSIAKTIAFGLFINGVIISLGLGILIANWDTTPNTEHLVNSFSEELSDSFYSRLKKIEKIILLLVICEIISGILVFWGIKEPLEGLDEVVIARANFALLCIWFFVRYSYYRAEQFQRVGRKLHGNLLRCFGTLMYFLILYGYAYYFYINRAH